MTVLLYDYCELEERASKHLRIWKVWHIILYVFAAIFGILNYTFLQSTMELVDSNCVLFPRELAFHMVKLPNLTESNVTNNVYTKLNETSASITEETATNAQTTAASVTDAVQTEYSTVNKDESEAITEKREALEHETRDTTQTTVVINNVTVVTGNSTHRLMLDTSRTLFAPESDCEFAEYMPIVSTIFSGVWITLFIMCPGGGRPRSGLQRPWRILFPALVFSLVMVGLTGHSFMRTNKGLQAFCSAFQNYTNATTCSSVSPLLERSWNSSWGVRSAWGVWGLGPRAAATRASCAGVWVSWACAATLLLARCLAAPDFQLKRTGVYLARDPHQKILPHLRQSSRRSQRSSPSSPTKRDTASVRSEPTATTELVTASIEHGQDSAPTSLTATPAPLRHQPTDDIEMTSTPRQLTANGR